MCGSAPPAIARVVAAVAVVVCAGAGHRVWCSEGWRVVGLWARIGFTLCSVVWCFGERLSLFRGIWGRSVLWRERTFFCVFDLRRY